jgi:hypothetical protein
LPKGRRGYKERPPRKTKVHWGYVEIVVEVGHSEGQNATSHGLRSRIRSRQRSREWGPKAQCFVEERGAGPSGPQALVFVEMHVQPMETAKVLGWLANRG